MDSMASTVTWAVFLGASVTLVAPVGAECDPSHAVVAVASVLSTLAAVTIVLIGIYFFLGRRRKGSKLHNNVYEIKKKGNEHNNYGFTDNENLTALEGVTTPRRRGQAHVPEQVLPVANSDQWSSPPRSVRLYREGSLGSLDETAKFADAEIISVTLESQDIIGLGFNICGNYGDGIRVSEVHNRGPAKESGNIQTGDRILSVAVSYQNIVYEDALTILSYASPYPVKIILEKATEQSSHNFEDEKQKGSRTQRITHPLFRSRSLNTLKHVNHSDNTTHPKRAVSDLKLESVKYFLNWRSKNSKRGNVNSHANGTGFGKMVTMQSDNLTDEHKATGGTTEHVRLDDSAYENKTPSYAKVRSTVYETVAEVTPVSRLNNAEEWNKYQQPHPGKPERRTKIDSSSLHSELYLENQVTTPRRTFAYPISSVTDDEIDVDEMFLTPAVSAYDEETASSGNISKNAQNTEHVTMHHHLEAQTPINANSFTETLFPTISTDIIDQLQRPSNNPEFSAHQVNPPKVNEETLDTLTTIHTDVASTGGLPDEHAARNQHDFVYDFAVNQPEHKSNSESPSNQISLHNPGNPFASEIAKHKARTEATQNSDKGNNSVSDSVLFPTSASFLNSKTSSGGSTSSRGSPANTDESEISDTLEWSGKRLVRSESFSNIFVDD